MAAGLVGSLGVVSVGAVGASVTAVWGAGSNRDVNNLLIGWVLSQGTSQVLPGLPSGWTAGISRQSNNAQSSRIIWRIATGGDAAPTLTPPAGCVLTVMLAEFVGNDATASANDRAGTAAGQGSPITATSGAKDVEAGEIVIYLGGAFYTVPNTETLTHTPNNGVVMNSVNNNNTVTADHYSFGWGLPTSTAAIDNDQLAFPSGLFSNLSTAQVILQSFKLTHVFTRTVADTATGSDADINKTILLGRTTDNAVTADDSQRRVSDVGRGTEGAAGADDAQRRITDSGRTTDNSVAADDDQRRLVAFTRSADDTASTSEVDFRAGAGVHGTVDTAANADSVARLLVLHRILADSGSTVDANIHSAAIAYTVSDSATATDAVTRLLLQHRTLANAAAASDTALAARAYIRALLDSVGADDAATRLLILLRSLSNAGSTVDMSTFGQMLSKFNGDLALINEQAPLSNLLDSSGNGHTGSLLGSVTYLDSPWVGYGTAIRFPGGSADYIDCGVIANPGPAMTIELKCRLKAWPAAGHRMELVAQQNAATGLFDLYVDENGFVVMLFGRDPSGAAQYTSVHVLTLDQVHDVAFAFDGSLATLWIDGQVEAFGNTIPLTTAANPATFCIGGPFIGAPTLFDTCYGTLDEVRYSSIARYTYDMPYVPSATPFVTDANTLGLWHADVGIGISRVLSLQRTPTESILTSEVAARQQSLLRSLADPLAASDGGDHSTSINYGTGDNAGATDVDLWHVPLYARSLADTASTADVDVWRNPHLFFTVADTASTADDNLHRIIQATYITDGASGADYTQRSLHLIRAYSDPIITPDLITYSILRAHYALVDSAGAADLSSRQLALLRYLADGASLQELVSHYGVFREATFIALLRRGKLVGIFRQGTTVPVLRAGVVE